MACHKTLLFFLILSLPSYGQVANDSVQNRQELVLGKPYTSYTAHSTVERNCMDESLTGKCIKYHNDQWFTFDSGDCTELFVNISQQRCKDLFGVQLVLLSGEPCNPESYDILSCTSSGTNDDFYVAASVKPHTNYLLIVDGYLEDFCTFDILLDSIPHGVPPEPNLSLPGEGSRVGKVVRLRWTLPDSLSEGIERFIVYQRNNAEYRFAAEDTVRVSRNTFGELQNDYTYTDTLNDHKMHFYRVVAQAYTNQQYLFTEYSFRKRRERKGISLPLDYRNNTPLTIVIWNATQEKVLERQTFVHQKERLKLWLDLTAYWDEGHSIVVVEVRDNQKKRSEITLVNLSQITL